MPSAKKNMNIFTNRFANNPTQPKVDIFKDILDSISTTGTATSNIKIIIGDNPGEILEFSFGQPRIKRSLEKKFRIISSIPDILSHRAGEIKCCLCNSVIHFNLPVWYYSIRYTGKFFHYFICSDKQSLEEQKPSTRCYRRD